MYTQLKKQSTAFIQGFHSIVDKKWIAIFSPHELQRLISGDHVELDVDDLRYIFLSYTRIGRGLGTCNSKHMVEH